MFKIQIHDGEADEWGDADLIIRQMGYAANKFNEWESNFVYSKVKHHDKFNRTIARIVPYDGKYIPLRNH